MSRRLSLALTVSINIFSLSLLSSCDRGDKSSLAGSPEGFPMQAARNVVVRSDDRGRVQYAEDSRFYQSDGEFRQNVERERERYQWQELSRDRRIEDQFPEQPNENLYFVEDASVLDAPESWSDENYFDEGDELALGGRSYYSGRPYRRRYRSFDCGFRVGYHRLRNYCGGSRRHYYPYTPIYRQPRRQWYYHPTYYWGRSYYYYVPVVTWHWNRWTYYTYSIWW